MTLEAKITDSIEGHKSTDGEDVITSVQKGINITCMKPNGSKKRIVNLFVPDGSQGRNRHHEIEIMETDGNDVISQRTVKAGSPEFDEALPEVIYYLGDDVQWYTPSRRGTIW